jgi:hypothetical protein
MDNKEILLPEDPRFETWLRMIRRSTSRRDWQKKSRNGKKWPRGWPKAAY